MLSRDFFIFTADCAKEAKQLWQKELFDLALLDILLPDCSGISLLREFKKDNPNTPIIMITGTRQVKTAVEAMKLGAYDYLTKPFTSEELGCVIKKALESKLEEDSAIKLIKKAKEERFFGEMIGQSPKVLDLYKMITQVMNTKTTVLIQGESGTGKELIARAIHYNGIRRTKPFIPVHIASLSNSLMESELFGHEKGSFTGALQSKKGTLEVADGGTIFLDEIGDIPLDIQIKLLRILQEKEFRHVGGLKNIKIDIRFIAATNRNLWKLVEEGVFREDLYYRISVVPINVPTLKERVSDIPLLAYYFIEKFRKDTKTPIQGFRDESMELLKKYNWPGNVRELENLVEQLLLTANHQWILPEDLPIYIHRNDFAAGKDNLLEKTISVYERSIIEKALKNSNGVVTKAADLLGTTRRILKYKMDKLGIPPSDEY